MWWSKILRYGATDVNHVGADAEVMKAEGTADTILFLGVDKDARDGECASADDGPPLCANE